MRCLIWINVTYRNISMLAYTVYALLLLREYAKMNITKDTILKYITVLYLYFNIHVKMQKMQCCCICAALSYFKPYNSHWMHSYCNVDCF